MSAYTDIEKTKSLWHPITDDDFEIDTDKPFILISDDGGLVFIKDKNDLSFYFDAKTELNSDKTFSEHGKICLQIFYLAYMYIDEQFYEAIKPIRHQCLEDCKGEKERPSLFVKYIEEDMLVLDHFDFKEDGSLALPQMQHITRIGQQENIFDDLSVEYIVNLQHCIATNPQILFSQPVLQPMVCATSENI